MQLNQPGPVRRRLVAGGGGPRGAGGLVHHGPVGEKRRKTVLDETCPNQLEETNMKLSIALSALLITGFVAASTEQASAVVYCQYVA